VWEKGKRGWKGGNTLRARGGRTLIGHGISKGFTVSNENNLELFFKFKKERGKDFEDRG